MEIFAINLDKNTERLQRLRKNLSECGLVFKRVKAVYGKQMPKRAKYSLASRFLWWCASGRYPMDGEIGCALSHLKIYREMIKRNVKVAAILEDDAIIRGDLKRQLQKIEERVDPNLPQIIFIAYHVDYKEPPKIDEFKIVSCDREVCSEAYVITNAAARVLYEINRPLMLPADGWTRWCKKGFLDMYHAYPILVTQDSHGGSEIKESSVGGGGSKLLHYIGRIFGRLVEESRWLILRCKAKRVVGLNGACGQ